MKALALAASALAAASLVQRPERESILASANVMDYVERVKAKDPLARTADEQSVLDYALANDFQPFPTDVLDFETHMFGRSAGILDLNYEDWMHQNPWARPARTVIRLGHHRPQVQNPAGSNARPRNVQQRKSRKANRRKRG